MACSFCRIPGHRRDKCPFLLGAGTSFKGCLQIAVFLLVGGLALVAFRRCGQMIGAFPPDPVAVDAGEAPPTAPAPKRTPGPLRPKPKLDGGVLDAGWGSAGLVDGGIPGASPGWKPRTIDGGAERP
jgi:hypothetical protein